MLIVKICLSLHLVLMTSYFGLTLKRMNRSKTISYSSYKKKEREKSVITLENELAKLKENYSDNQDEINQMEQELKTYEKKKYGV